MPSSVDDETGSQDGASLFKVKCRSETQVGPLVTGPVLFSYRVPCLPISEGILQFSCWRTINSEVPQNEIPG